MQPSFLDHPAERAGLITITDSLTRGFKAKDLRDIKYVLIDPHGSLEVPPIPGLEHHLGRYDSDSIHRYLATERDLGIPELRARLLDLLPNTVAIHFNINRGLADPNRQPPFALSSIGKQADPSVQKALLARHIRSGKAVDEILAQLPNDVRISLLHSTELYEAPDLRTLDLSTPANFRAYLDAVCGVGQVEYRNCFITGDADGSTHGDRQFRLTLERHLQAEGIPSVLDSPYVTKLGRHMTSSYMLRHPGRVNAVDWRKDELAEGSGADGTFVLDRSMSDPKKVDRIANLFADALKKVSRDQSL